MVRAATTGAIDFTQADPKDKWWWRKLEWITSEIANQALTAAYAAQHTHWITVFSNSKLTPESFETAQKNAQEALHDLLGALLPWRKADFAKPAAGGSAEEMLAEFREMYGYPGDPRYEKMLAETMAAFKAAA